MNRKRSANTAAPAGPCCFVIFGASGDLTHRLLVPALYNLAAGGLSARAFSIIGVARSEMSDEAFRTDHGERLAPLCDRRRSTTMIADRLLAGVSYVNGDADDPATYERLIESSRGSNSARDTRGNRLFYLATPPAAFAPIGRHLGRSVSRARRTGRGVGSSSRNRSAPISPRRRHSIESFSGVLEEHQIYRIDHYLGKETVQNILVLRFANGMFEPIWNRDHIDHVQITVAETLTVGRRGRFYDATGALARHGAEPSVPAAVARGHGAARRASRRTPSARKRPKLSTRCMCRMKPRRCETPCARNMLRRGWETTRSRIIAERPT